jgi:hypothetical protein
LEVSILLSEFNVRAEASRIEVLQANPIHKARMLLGVARRVRSAACRLVLLSQHHFRIGDPLCGARFREAAHRLCDVHEEIRAKARRILRPVPEPAGYGYTPMGNAFPLWNESEEAAVGGAR